MSDLFKENEALKASLVLAYELSFKYWAECAGNDHTGDDAKELRRDIWDKCLAPHNIPHPKGWGT